MEWLGLGKLTATLAQSFGAASGRNDERRIKRVIAMSSSLSVCRRFNNGRQCNISGTVLCC
jgi:hypothetical protein